MEGRRFVGIDLAKRTYEACALGTGDYRERWNGRTDECGRSRLAARLLAGDVVAMEAGVTTFETARTIVTLRPDVRVVILNPGKLAVIYASMKKTDKEDAFKLAWLVQAFPEAYLPTVPLPSMEELQMRRLSKAQVFLKQERTRLINHLHALFVSDGITSMSKRLLATGKSRRMAVKRLTPLHETLASQILSVIDEVEVRLSEIGDLIKGMLEGHPDEATILLSIPGVGPMTAAAFLAYIGDGSRFANASQVSNFAGLVPRIDSSGETTRYGHITRSGNSIIRRAAVQAAWAAIRSYAGGVFRETFERIKARRGSSIAIVAIARRIVELMYSLLKSGELYRYGSEEDRLRKLRRYKIELVGTGGLDATT